MAFYHLYDLYNYVSGNRPEIVWEGIKKHFVPKEVKALFDTLDEGFDPEFDYDAAITEAFLAAGKRCKQKGDELKDIYGSKG